MRRQLNLNYSAYNKKTQSHFRDWVSYRQIK
jgi:hypothetical protein